MNSPAFENDPGKALGPPVGWGIENGNATSVVSLGGFGGSITLGFDHTVRDDRANPLGLDAIVFGNAVWIIPPGHEDPDPNSHWAEAGQIEICRDINGNGVADDPWYLIPGSHIADPPGQMETQTWDADLSDPTYPPNSPPATPTWIPPAYVGYTGTWDTVAYRLPPDIFDIEGVEGVVNPNGPTATEEGIYGYADFTPTLLLGDLDADDLVDDDTITPQTFYTVPDDPSTVGIRAGSGGGDAFDIAWAVAPETGEPAELDGFDFIRITTSVNFVTAFFGEVSTDIDAVSDVAPGLLGDADADWDVDLWDFAAFEDCAALSASAGLATYCRVMDFDDDGRVDLNDFGGFQAAFTGVQ